MTFKSRISSLDPGNAPLHRLSHLYALFAVPLLLIVLILAGWPTADGHHDRAGETFGHDLSQVWVAGRAAIAGQATDVYDIPLHCRRLVETFGPDAALFAWHYPPIFFGPAAALATMPYAGAVLVWGLGSLMLIGATLRRILGAWRPVLVGLALPPVFQCLGYGQNGLLTASLLGLALTFIDRRPVMAGALLGLLSYKPQLAVVAPLVMLVTGRWRVAAAALACDVALVAGSIAALGPAVWGAFLGSLSETNNLILEQARSGLSLDASAFGAVRIFGGSTGAAWTAQGVVALLSLGFVLKLWLSPCPPALRNATLTAVIPLVSPYVPVYDLAVLVPAAAFFIVGVDGRFRQGERIAIPGLLALAFDPRNLTSITHLPCGFIAAGGTFALIAAGAWARSAAQASEKAGFVAVVGAAGAISSLA